MLKLFCSYVAFNGNMKVLCMDQQKKLVEGYDRFLPKIRLSQREFKEVGAFQIFSNIQRILNW